MLGIKLTGRRQHPNETQDPGTDKQKSSKHDAPLLVLKKLVQIALLAHVQIPNCPIVIS
jgi:hypothetical protein